MTINMTFAPLILFFIAIFPAFLGYRVAKNTNRSKFATAAIVFFLGLFTWVGGWLYLALINKPLKVTT